MGRVLARMPTSGISAASPSAHSVAAGHAHELIGLDAAPLHVEAERRDQRMRSVADGGDDGRGRDDAASVSSTAEPVADFVPIRLAPRCRVS
jgi:hypothetical protein